LRDLDNAVLTPHLGYVADDTMRIWYEDTVEAVTSSWTGGRSAC
jgi:hypothetical protein